MLALYRYEGKRRVGSKSSGLRAILYVRLHQHLRNDRNKTRSRQLSLVPGVKIRYGCTKEPLQPVHPVQRGALSQETGVIYLLQQ